MTDFDSPFDQPVVLPLSDSLDLHTFNPRELPDLLDDWLEECLKAGLSQVRIIHGKGRGVLRQRVHSLLAGHGLVASFGLDPLNPGATLIELKGRG